MSSLQSLRELISERLAAAAEEIFRLCEGTIVQYEQELCRQRRLLDVIWKPQLQLHHIAAHNRGHAMDLVITYSLSAGGSVLPQHWMTEEEDLCNQQRIFRVEQEEPEPPQIKEEPGEYCISQDEDQLELKQETYTLKEIPTNEEDENSEADLNNQQSFNVTDSQDEEGNQHEKSKSTTDEETDPQKIDQRKRRDRSHVQSVDSSHMSAGLPQCWMTKEEDVCIQQRNFRVEQDELECPQIEEEMQEPEPPQIKEEPGELCISQDEDQLDLKQETDTLMEIPTIEEDENSEADLKNRQSFNVSDSQDEEGNQHEESTSTTDEETDSTSTTDEETDPQNREQRKKRDRSHVQSMDSSHTSESQCDTDVRNNPKKTNLAPEEDIWELPGLNRSRLQRVSTVRPGGPARQQRRRDPPGGGAEEELLRLGVGEALQVPRRRQSGREQGRGGLEGRRVHRRLSMKYVFRVHTP
ncbi:uncharacterized protein LOC110016657 isoform X2 [Oryzias latipes]